MRIGYPQKRRSKYGNRKTTSSDGNMFDSVKEAKRYEELRLLQRGGKIKNLQLQPRFVLQDKFKRDGKTYRKIEYVADFMYEKDDGTVVVEDVKGMKTDVYKLKKKLFLAKYPFEFVEI